ncbi:FAD-dependent oxidoreductase [Paenibacillus eucommiae]|uniref:FAD-dependent oxidoreductase n=1 Tax=Paenibacillus eucommiae TaxID=1355755 RepID=A0ABS4J9F8_9BACL|nr:FAD-dependent oxidoreductase [Paenibacillus eucommiae]MBP1995711.1 hypothetical protein [Paenibacillus eucommiae]
MNNNQITDKSTSHIWKLWMGALILAAVLAAAAALYWQHNHPHNGLQVGGGVNALDKVESAQTIRDSYDVIVVGTDPEGVAAALSAARNGLSTLLVDGRGRDILGGLMTLGWLNTIDMNYTPDQPIGGRHKVFNKGIFSEWYNQIEGDSFDVITAANAFNKMVKEQKNIDLLLKTVSIDPVMSSGSDGNEVIEGIVVVKEDGTKQTISAKSVIDATQDADIAAAAGVPYTYGREDLGDPDAKMAVTLVFRLKNVTPDVWKQIQKRLNGDDDPGTGANEVSAWGYGELYNYPEVYKNKAKMRGLNIGRQNNDTALINALQIFDVDGVDPQSRADAFEVGKKEVVHVVDFLRKNYPEFANVELEATAPELYVRETRHIQGEYRLTILDVLENRDQWDRIGFGSYQVDIQRLSAAHFGDVVGKPVQYAVPFRSIVPLHVDGLLVVSRSASYDSLPHGSARVIPTGMAVAEAAGAAAKLVQEKNLTFRQLSASKADIAELQVRINKQGMEVKPFSVKPQPFMGHKQYEGLKTAMSLSLAKGGYKNDFHLDDAASPASMANLIKASKAIKPDAFKGDAHTALGKVGSPDTAPLTIDQASYTITQALGMEVVFEQAKAELLRQKLLTEASMALITDQQSLTNGDVYMIIKDLKVGLTGTP